MGTYTYVVLDVSDAAFEEIKAKLEKAGYSNQFDTDPQGRTVIDMHGIALQATTPVDTQTPDLFAHKVYANANDALHAGALDRDNSTRDYMEKHHGQLPPQSLPLDHTM